MTTSPLLDPARIAADRAALRRFARSLLRDCAEVEDLVQEAWVRALRGYVGVSAHRVPWMTVVLRNLAHRSRRSSGRRRDRESAFQEALERAAPGADEALERLETQRRLVEAVQQLDEPFRSTVLLVYFEGVSPSRLAASSGVPAGTVRWRLNAALERVRRRLAQDEKGGEERGQTRDGRLAIAPPIASSPSVGSLLKGLAAVKVPLQVIAASACLVGLVAAVRTGTSRTDLQPDIDDPLEPPATELTRAADVWAVPFGRGGQSSPARLEGAGPRVPRLLALEGEPSADSGSAGNGTPENLTTRQKRLAAVDDPPPEADELARRARRCEIRWDVPGAKSDERFQSQGWATEAELVALGLATGEMDLVTSALARYKSALAEAERRAVAELLGEPDTSLAGADVDAVEARLMSLMGRLRPGEMAAARQVLAQEAAGLRSRTTDADRPLGERLYRIAEGLADDFERDLVREAGATRASELRKMLSGRQSNAGCPRAR